MHPHLPGPRFLRVATLIVIDTHEHVALIRPSGSSAGAWALPQRPVRLVESYAEAASHLAAQCFSGMTFLWGTVVGRRWAPPPGQKSHARTEQHLVFARVKPSGSPRRTHTTEPRPAVAWVARTTLQRVLPEAHHDSTATLIGGYLDGWLPDGPITLY